MGLWLLVAYFAVKAGYFAVRISERIFPDEASWFGLAQVFSHSRWLPVDSPESYPFGLATHIPSLYFFLMGKMLTGNVFPLSDLLFLRLVNVGLGLLTVVFAWRLICLLSGQTTVRLLFLCMTTNTLMLTFLFSGVSYDNLVNLLAVMAWYFFCDLTTRRDLSALPRLIIVILAGCLTKITFLPLAVLFGLAFLWQEGCRWRWGRGDCPWIHSRRGSAGELLGWLAGIALAGAVLTLYGGNWLRYGQLTPSVEAVVGRENALKNRIVARDYAVSQYRNGTLSYLDAQRLILQIREASDREDSLNLLAIAQDEKLRPDQVPPPIGRWGYVGEWCKRIMPQIFGIMAHKTMLKEGGLALSPYLGLGLWAMLGWLVNTLRRPGLGASNQSGEGLSSSAIPLFWVTSAYLIFLMQWANYATYQGSGVLFLALQGRYTFPVLLSGYSLLAYYAVGVWPPRWRWGLTILFGLGFLGGEFPWFCAHVSPEWFFPR